MKNFLIALLAISVIGCASYLPVADLKGVDQMAYEKDLKECQALAEEVNPTGKAIAGAVAGAVVGALLGSVGGGRMAGVGAQAGLVAGGATGAANGAGGQINVVRNCLTGRGYRVLN